MCTQGQRIHGVSLLFVWFRVSQLGPPDVHDTGGDVDAEEVLERMYIAKMKKSFQRGPDWAQAGGSKREEAVNFGRYTPRRVSTRDVVEPDHGGFVKRLVRRNTFLQ